MKLSYQQLTVELEKLFQAVSSKQPEASDKEVEEYCATVDALIEAAGWGVEEYYTAFVDANWD